jgi:hypothetical protein
MASSFLSFFDMSRIEHTTAFVLRSMAHTMLGTVYHCTYARYSSLCTLMISCFYFTVQIPGATLASTEAWRVNLFWPMRDQHMNPIDQSSYCHILPQTDHPSIHPSIQQLLPIEAPCICICRSLKIQILFCKYHRHKVSLQCVVFYAQSF